MFDFFWKPRAKYPAYLGHTVYQSEYDALKAECDRAHEATALAQSQALEHAGELDLIHQYLEPFGALDSGPDAEGQSAVELAASARDLLGSDTKIIQGLNRDIEQLQEQLQESTSVKLQFELDTANETIELWKDRYD